MSIVEIEWRLVTDKNKSTTELDQPDGPGRASVMRAMDFLIFFTILALSAIAVVVLAVTAPVALAVSAITGLFHKNGDRGQWRPAGV